MKSILLPLFILSLIGFVIAEKNKGPSESETQCLKGKGRNDLVENFGSIMNPRRAFQDCVKSYRFDGTSQSEASELCKDKDPKRELSNEEQRRHDEDQGIIQGCVDVERQVRKDLRMLYRMALRALRADGSLKISEVLQSSACQLITEGTAEHPDQIEGICNSDIDVDGDDDNSCGGRGKDEDGEDAKGGRGKNEGGKGGGRKGKDQDGTDTGAGEGEETRRGPGRNGPKGSKTEAV